MKIINENIALVGDIHAGIHGSSAIWHNILLDYGRWLRDNLKDNLIKDIIFLGDILHDRNEISVPTLHCLPQFFKLLEDFNIIILVGNHDCFYSKRSDVHSLRILDDWPNITIVDKPITITAHDKVITICPWATDIDSIPKSDILFGHFEIKTFKMSGKKLCEHGIDSKQLLEKAPLIFTGHFHEYQERKYQDGAIIYAGSTYEQNFGEANQPKGIINLNISTGNYTFIENTISPKHKYIRLTEILSIGKINEQIKKDFNGNIVTFIVDSVIETDALDKLVQRLNLLNPLELRVEHYIIKKDLDIDDHVLEFQGVDIQNDLREFVDKLEGVENKENVINYLLELYKEVEHA